MKAMILQQKMPDGYLTSTRREQITGTRGTREAWVAEAMIKDAAQRVRKWKHPHTGMRETAQSYRRRMILNVAIKESLKKYPEFFANELEGDNYTIVRNVIMFGEPSSKKMKIDLESRLSAHVKTKELTYQEYESQLRGMWEECATIGRIVSDEDKTLKLIAGMERDWRYKDAVRDVSNSDSSYAQCHSVFMQEAHSKKDLWRAQRATGDINSLNDYGKGRGRGGGKGGRGRGKGGRGGKGGKGGKGTKSQSRQNACVFFLAHGTCRFGDKCRSSHISLAEFQSKKAGNKNGGDKEERPEAKRGDRKKQLCYSWQQEGTCDYGDKCRYEHQDGDIEMMEKEKEYEKGAHVQVVDVPKKSAFKNLVAEVVGMKGNRYTLKPTTPIAKQHRVYLMSTGLKPQNLARKKKPQILSQNKDHGKKEPPNEIMSADRISPYDFRTAFDPCADWTVTPTEKNLVKGSVKTLAKPIRAGGFTKGGPVVEFHLVGLLCLKSNTGMPGYLAVPAYVTPLAKRTLISHARLDDMGWTLELGGGVARMRRLGSQANFLVLPRFDEAHDGLPMINITEEMKYGEQDLRSRLGEQGGTKYPVPDDLVVTDFNDINEINSIDQEDHECNERKEGEINLAQRYSQQEKLELMHQLLGHTNYHRLALMMHWDGNGPKPSSHVLAKPCAVCAISKAHAWPVRKESYEFKDDTILGHVFADLGTSMGKSIEGFEHFLSIFVQGPAIYFVFCLRTRGEANQWLMVWMRRAHTLHFPHKIKHLHVDGELLGVSSRPLFVTGLYSGYWRWGI